EDEREEPLVLGVEPLADDPQRLVRIVEPARIDVDRYVEALAEVPDVDLVGDLLLVLGYPLAGQPARRGRGQVAQDARQLAAGQVGEPAQAGAGRFVPGRGRGVAEGAQH